MDKELLGNIDEIDEIIQDMLEGFVNIKPRNHYFSLYAFDLYGLLKYKPSNTLWRKLVKQDFDNETEGWLFKHIIDYALKDSDLIYTTMVKPFLESVRNSLRVEKDMEVNEITPEIVREATTYITELSSKLNQITHNILNTSRDMAYGVLDGESGYNIGITKYSNANEYFENEDESLYFIHSVTIRFKDDGFRGLLIIWLLRKA